MQESIKFLTYLIITRQTLNGIQGKKIEEKKMLREEGRQKRNDKESKGPEDGSELLRKALINKFNNAKTLKLIKKRGYNTKCGI